MIVFAPFVIQTEKFNRDSIGHCGDLRSEDSWALRVHMRRYFLHFSGCIVGNLIDRVQRN
nr:MAG TPA: hypothetical protein [Caudoviricetes sp.]